MTNKKLTPSEILRALADGKAIKYGDCFYKFIDGLIYYRFEYLSDDYQIEDNFNLNYILSQRGIEIYTPPEPKKKLSEGFLLWAEDYLNKQNGYPNNAEIYNWLKENEDED